MFSFLKKRLKGIPGNKAELWQQEIVDEVKDYTMTSPVNITALTAGVKYLVENNIDGDIVECGVWKGGSMLAIAKTLIHFGDLKRQLFLYDTFAEFSAPEDIDVSVDGEKGIDVLKRLANPGSVWTAPDLGEVKNNLIRTGYPVEKMHFIKGEVEKTIPGIIPGKISLLRLDTDWYASTRHELEWLYPLLANGGILLIDDYGFWKGSKKAVDEYFSKYNISTPLIKIDRSARMIIKDQN